MKYKNLPQLELAGLVCLVALCVTDCSDDRQTNDNNIGSAGAAGGPMSASAGEAGEPGVNVCGQPGRFSQCDPISAVPCDIAAGETCDFATNLGGFVCFPGPNSAQPGGKCDTDSLFCGHSTTCDVMVSMCEHYCCDDSDCLHGRCSPHAFDDGKASVGLCYDEYRAVGASAGAGGEGG